MQEQVKDVVDELVNDFLLKEDGFDVSEACATYKFPVKDHPELQAVVCITVKKRDTNDLQTN